MIPGAEPWATIIQSVVKDVGGSAEKITKLKELNTYEKKQKVAEAIKELKQPIVVIIDDIDRLPPAETFQILRLVKAVADFPNTAFLLAFDPKYLTTVLEKNNIDNAKEYLNKVIQLRVPLPIISDKNMVELAEEEINKLGYKDLTNDFKDDSERLSHIFNQYFCPLIKNPREMNRFFNHLRFSLIQLKGEVCFSDIFSLSIIESKANDIYEHIKKVSQAYIGDETGKEITKEFEKERNSLLKVFDENDKKLIHQLLCQLFPLLKKENEHFYIFDATNSYAEGRVANKTRLYTALHYGTPPEHVSEQEIKRFINDSINRKDFLQKIIANDLDHSFFQKLTNYKADAQVLIAIHNAYIHSDKLKNSLWGKYGLSSMLYKITSINSNYTPELLKSLVNNKHSLAFFPQTLYKVKKDNLIAENQLKIIEKDYQIKAEAVLNNNEIKDMILEKEIFLGLEEVMSKEKAKDFLTNFQKTHGIMRALEIIAYSGTNSTNGPYTKINKERFSDIFYLEQDRQALKDSDESIMDIINNAQMDDSKYSFPQQAAIKTLFDGKAYYLIDATSAERDIF